MISGEIDVNLFAHLETGHYQRMERTETYCETLSLFHPLLPEIHCFLKKNLAERLSLWNQDLNKELNEFFSNVLERLNSKSVNTFWNII